MTNGATMPAPFPARMNVFLRDRTNGTIMLVSADASGVAGGNGNSMPAGLSTNGQFALFESSASDLAANDTNNATDIFVRDLVNGTNILVSVSTVGKPGNGVSRGPVMTPSGRYVAFVSTSSNLVAGDTNGIADVFVRDLVSATTVLVSVGSKATNSLSVSEAPGISDDGRYVAFYSTATNLVAGVGTASEIYLRDIANGVTSLASTNTRVALSNINVVSYNHAMSADGKFIAYAARRMSGIPATFIFRYNRDTGLNDLVHTNAIISSAPVADRTLDITPDGRFIAFLANTNVAGSTNPIVCVWDAQTGTSTVASRNILNGIGVGSFDWPSIDSTGRYVCFTSTATNLTSNSGVTGHHVYRRDLLLNETTMIDAVINGVGLDVASFTVPAFSANGQLVAFESFVESGVNNPRRHTQIYLRDLQTNTLELISARLPELPSISPNAPSDLSSSSVSANGRFVAFASLASNLAPGDTNANRDVFVRDLLNGTNILISAGTNGFSGAGMSFEPSISGDGNFVAFTSTATNFVPGDTNKMRDVFVVDLQTKALTLGSVAVNGVAGNNASYSPIISAGGKFILFRSKASNLAPGTFSGENLFWRDLQNSNTLALTTGGIAEAVMASDSRFIAFVGKIPGGTVSNFYIWDSSAAARIYTNLSAGITGIAISGDANRLALVIADVLYGFDRMANTNWVIGVWSNNRGGLRFSADGRFLAHSHSSIYLYDFETKTNTLVSLAWDGKKSDPDISYDGRFVAYRSAAPNLVPNDTNSLPDVFIYDRLTGTNTLLSANVSGKSGDNRSFAPVLSGNGRTLVFPSWASDLTANDFNHVGDLFSFSFLYAEVTRGNPGEAPVISWPATPDGNYQVQFKNNVNDAIWQELNGTITFQGNKAFIQDAAPAADHRIYRVVAF